MSEYVHLDVEEIEAETDLALLLIIPQKGKRTPLKVWVPKSVIADAEDYAEGDTDATVSVQSWWTEKEGLK